MELLVAEDVRHRLVPAPSLYEVEKAPLAFRREGSLREGEHAGFAESRRLGEQQARLARVDARRGQRFLDGQAASSASCASCSERCSAASAASSSSSSPSMMRSILYSVRLMRWSVT